MSNFEKTAIRNYWDSFIKDKVYYYADFKKYIDNEINITECARKAGKE
jgi:hypothetical protein